MSSKRSSHNFTFSKGADDLVLEPLNFDKFGGDYFSAAEDSLIRKYIEDEAIAFAEDKNGDLQELKKEFEELGGQIDKLKEVADGLDTRSEAAATKHAEMQEKIDGFKHNITETKGADSTTNKQISDLSQMANDMSEQRNKWVKDCTKKNMDEVHKAMANANADPEVSVHHRFIMDSLAKFFSGNNEATFESHKAEFFVDAPTYCGHIRKCHPELLDKETITKIAESVNQADSQPGDTQKFMVQVERAKVNVHFYVHYKLLFKICQMGFTIRKKIGLEKKILGSTKRINEWQTEQETYEMIAENLEFGKKMAAEATRMREQEIAVLQTKFETLESAIADREGVDFVAEYFEDI